MGFLELLDELVAIHIVGRKAMLGHHKAQGGGEMGLAHTWRAEEDYVLTLLQEAHGGQLVDLALVNGGLKGKIEIVQSLLDGEAGHLNLFLIGPFPLGFGFFREDMVQDVHNIEVFGHSPLQIIIQNLQGVFYLETFQVSPQPVHSKFSHIAPRHI